MTTLPLCTIQTGMPPDAEARGGILYLRRPKGRAYTFLLAGPSFVEAPGKINWTTVAADGNWVFWRGEAGLYRVLPPTHPDNLV